MPYYYKEECKHLQHRAQHIFDMSHFIYWWSKSLQLISLTNISWGGKFFSREFYTLASCLSIRSSVSLGALIVFCCSDRALSTMIKLGSNHTYKSPPSLQLVILACFQKKRSMCACTFTLKAEEQKIRKVLQIHHLVLNNKLQWQDQSDSETRLKLCFSIARF